MLSLVFFFETLFEIDKSVKSIPILYSYIIYIIWLTFFIVKSKGFCMLCLLESFMVLSMLILYKLGTFMPKGTLIVWSHLLQYLLTCIESFKKPIAQHGRLHTVSTPQMEEMLHEIEEYPSICKRKIAANLNIYQSTVLRIVSSNIAVCRYMQAEYHQNLEFLGEILFTDEANFTGEVITNFRNNYGCESA